MKVLVLYHTIYGHTLQLARAVEEGVKSVVGVEAVFRRAPEFPHIEERLEASDGYETKIFRDQKDIQVCTLDDLRTILMRTRSRPLPLFLINLAQTLSFPN